MSAEPSKTSSTQLQPAHASPPPEQGGSNLVATARAWLRIAFVENAALKFVALVLALTVFVLVHSEENEVYHPWVSVTYSQEDTRVLTSKRVDQIQISVRGTRRSIKRLQKRRLDNIHIDLERLSTGNLRIEPEMFDLPEGVELISVNPPSIYLEFDDRTDKMLPVQIDTVGLPARGYKLGSLTASPSQVRVTGASKILQEMSAIPTKKVNLTGRTKSFEGPVPLLATNLDPLVTPEVNVSIQIIEDLEARQLAAKKVAIRAPDGLALDLTRFRVEPPSVDVTMYGAVHALEAIDADKIEVFVVVEPGDLSSDEARQVELRVEPMLSDIAYKIAPTEVTLRVVARRPAPAPAPSPQAPAPRP